MSVRFPSEDVVEERIGIWETIAGQNPDADELADAAVDILDSSETVRVRLIQRSLQYVWRRQQMPHGVEWKRAEDRLNRALEVSQ